MNAAKPEGLKPANCRAKTGGADPVKNMVRTWLDGSRRDRMSWRILVSVSTSSVQKGSLFENRRKGATPVMDMALWGGQKPESQNSEPRSPGYRAQRKPKW